MVAIEIQPGIEYACHDGVSLLGDLYSPVATGSYPALLVIHGGAWKQSSRATYRHWGPYLAEHGYVVFSVDYRLAAPSLPTYPQNVHDVKAAIQFMRGKCGALKIDPERIGVMGDSAGGHLSALLALSGDSPKLASPYVDDQYFGVSTRLRVAVPIYGVFDLLRQWEHDQLERPEDQITEAYLGGSPMQIRDRFYEASPISWTKFDNNGAAFLVVWGTADDVVDAETQSIPFVTALKRANGFVRTAPIQGAPHYWVHEPLDDPQSYSSFFAPKLMRFLAERL
ncbi:MAG: esterase/lipase [Chloroflexi bacterium]|nr:esterase/lipase [Chloroflexota bacterium]